MSENTIKFKKGVSLVPQSSDPVNPQEGDVFYSDGTSRAKGLWAYNGSTWKESGKESQINEEVFTLDATDVSNGYVDLQTEAYSNSELVWKNDGTGLKFRGTDFTTALNGTQTRVSFLAPFSATIGDKVAVNYQSDLFVPSGARSAIYTDNSTYTRFADSTIHNGASQIVFTAWVYINADTGTEEIFTFRRASTGIGLQLVYSHTSGNLILFTGGTSPSQQSQISFSTGQWNHIAVVFCANTDPLYGTLGQNQIFVNGSNSGLSAASTNFGVGSLDAANAGVLSGIGGTVNYWYDGLFANAHVFLDKGITASDITSLYNAGYYTDPNPIISKTANHGYLFGDLSSGDTTTVIQDQNGTNDLTVFGTAFTFSTNVP